MVDEPTNEGSREIPDRKGLQPVLIGLRRFGFPALAGLAGLLLVVADFSTLISIEVITVQREKVLGREQHGYAIAIVGVVTVVMAVGALRGARSAKLALLALGAVALGITLLGDLPDINSTGLVGSLYEEASARPGLGFYLESLGAVLLLFAAASMLLLGDEDEPPGGVAGP